MRAMRKDEILVQTHRETERDREEENTKGTTKEQQDTHTLDGASIFITFMTIP